MPLKTLCPPIKTAIIGLGRSGYKVHIKAIAKLTDKYAIVAVADTCPERADAVARELGAKSYYSLQALLSDSNVELVVIAVPNHLHTEYTLAAIAKGKSVICDKPFGVSAGEAQSMANAAAARGVHLGPFYSRRYEAAFKKVCEIVRSGTLGDIVHVRMNWGSFARRWDWQTLREFAGGQLNNNFPHALDQALQVYESAGYATYRQLEIFADLRTTLGVGDAEDHVRVTLRAPKRGMTMDIELFATEAYAVDRWSICGTRGGLRGDLRRLEWKWVAKENWPSRTPNRQSSVDRSYSHEELQWNSESFTAGDEFGDWQREYYEHFFQAIRANIPLSVSVKSACLVAEMLDRIRQKALTCETTSP